MRQINAFPDARIFIRLLRTGQIPKAIMPNTSCDYTKYQEREDTDYYTNMFLQSSIYDIVEKSEAVTYNGE